MINIHQPSFEELQSCFDLEVSLSHDVEDASEKGFFLPGTSFKLYEDLLGSGYIRILTEGDEALGFVMVVPPGHPIITRLLINNESIIWFEDESEYPSPENCFWIAKIAVIENSKRQGYGRTLYNHVFDNFKGLTALTATAVSPIRNHPSERFHMAMGLKACGLFLSGTRGDLENIVNILWTHKP